MANQRTTINQVVLQGRVGNLHAVEGRLYLTLVESVWNKKDESYDQQRHNVVVFGEQAENLTELLEEGNLVSASGRLNSYSYQDDNNDWVNKVNVVGFSVNQIDTLTWDDLTS